MTKIEKEEEEEKLIRDNPHLERYLDDIAEKMGRPAFYSKLPRDVKGKEFPNLIYTTKGVVFIHMVRTKDMDAIEYHAIAPILSEGELEKRDLVSGRMYEKAHFYKGGFIKTQDDLRKAIKESILRR